MTSFQIAVGDARQNSAICVCSVLLVEPVAAPITKTSL
jgi:hypothetical protein